MADTADTHALAAHREKHLAGLKRTEAAVSSRCALELQVEPSVVQARYSLGRRMWHLRLAARECRPRRRTFARRRLRKITICGSGRWVSLIAALEVENMHLDGPVVSVLCTSHGDARPRALWTMHLHEIWPKPWARRSPPRRRR